MGLNRPKIHNRLQDPADEMPARRIPENNPPTHHHKSAMRSVDPATQPQANSFLPKLNTNGNRGTQNMRGLNDISQWAHDRQSRKDDISYLDKYEKVLMQKNGLHFPDIKDRKGTAARHMRIIKPKPKEMIHLDVVDNGEPLYGKFEKNFELPSISGHGMKIETSPRSKTPAQRCPSRSPTASQKLPPIGSQQHTIHKKRGKN